MFHLYLTIYHPAQLPPTPLLPQYIPLVATTSDCLTSSQQQTPGLVYRVSSLSHHLPSHPTPPPTPLLPQYIPLVATTSDCLTSSQQQTPGLVYHVSSLSHHLPSRPTPPHTPPAPIHTPGSDHIWLSDLITAANSRTGLPCFIFISPFTIPPNSPPTPLLPQYIPLVATTSDCLTSSQQQTPGLVYHVSSLSHHLPSRPTPPHTPPAPVHTPGSDHIWLSDLITAANSRTGLPCFIFISPFTIPPNSPPTPLLPQYIPLVATTSDCLTSSQQQTPGLVYHVSSLSHHLPSRPTPPHTPPAPIHTPGSDHIWLSDLITAANSRTGLPCFIFISPFTIFHLKTKHRAILSDKSCNTLPLTRDN